MQVLRILEGDAMDSGHLSTPRFDVDSQSGRIWSEHQLKHEQLSSPIGNETAGRFSSKLAYNPRPSFREREKARASYEDHL